MRGFMMFTHHRILYAINSQIMGWVEHVVRIGVKKNVCRILGGKPEGKKALGIPGHRWEDNIKMVIKCDEKD
jgi:ferredoxin-thioredoxin reductase catalytic subunit